MSGINDDMELKAQKVVRYLGDFFAQPQTTSESLLKAVRYSVLQEGGKRFRPALAMLTAEALGFPAERVLPYASAVECIHTYSLIHDDLPAMDNDDFRRGQPTNHKVFGEATALLAGDSLLTEAFHIIASAYADEPLVGLKAVAELAQAAGVWGMVGGQAMDMAAQTYLETSGAAPTRESVELMHRLKTGALIRSAAVGAGILCSANPQQLKDLKKFSENLGLAFQVTDDILDYDPNKIEAGSYPALLGLEGTKAFLAQLTEDCLSSLESWSKLAEPLRELARFNQSRVH